MAEIEQLFTNIESNYDQWASAFSSMVVDQSDPLSVDKFANCLKKMSPQVALPMAKTVFLADYREILDKVVVPCHIIQTRNDVVVPLFVAKYMQEKIKGETTLEIVETEGHFPQLTAHLKFVELINRFLGS